jgi:hypothetical protein
MTGSTFKTSNGKAASMVPVSPLKSSPKAAATSPTKGSIKKKDYSPLLIVEGCQAGILVMWVKKASKMEQTYFKPELDMLKENESYRDELGINEIVPRKGVDGNTPKPQAPGSIYSWMQALVVAGVEENSGDTTATPEVRRRYADAWIEKINEHQDLYQYPQLYKFGQDRTRNPPRPVSAVLLNEAVCDLMVNANEEYAESPAEMANFPLIMAAFWENIEEGATALEAYGNGAGQFDD